MMPWWSMVTMASAAVFRTAWSSSSRSRSDCVRSATWRSRVSLRCRSASRASRCSVISKLTPIIRIGFPFMSFRS